MSSGMLVFTVCCFWSVLLCVTAGGNDQNGAVNGDQCADVACIDQIDNDEVNALQTSLLQTRRHHQVDARNDQEVEELDRRKTDLVAELENVEAELSTFKEHGDDAPANLLALGVGCHDMKENDEGICMDAINWGKYTGLVDHPEWYPPNLTNTTPVAKWQEFVYKHARGKCPRPCGLPNSTMCTGTPTDEFPKLWKPAAPNSTVAVKILSYNLFWWNLFKIHKGRGGSVPKLIKRFSYPPFDVMGFQECEDPSQVIAMGLEDEYQVFNGTHNICMAFRKAAWTLLEHGQDDIAEDQITEYYGNRAVQWMRLNHTETGSTLLFANHHGPLSVNSGGECGGTEVAYNIVKLLSAKGKVGDILVVVGDFNANAVSTTIQELWKHLVLVYNGDSFGGVDNIFTNTGTSSVVATQSLGSAGSDHNAISATVRVTSEDAQATKSTRAQPAHTCAEIGCHKGYHSWLPCQCTSSCRRYGNCCHDYYLKCDGGGHKTSCAEMGCNVRFDRHLPCQCNADCATYKDCCADYAAQCKDNGHNVSHEDSGSSSTSGHNKATCAEIGCNAPYNWKLPCQCNPGCARHGNCCKDYHSVCFSGDGGAPHAGRSVASEPAKALKDASQTQCGVLDNGVEYAFEAHAWSRNADRITDPRVCCSLCNKDWRCKAWVWNEFVDSISGPRCSLRGGRVVGHNKKEGVVSGLPKSEALARAYKEKAHAIAEMP